MCLYSRCMFLSKVYQSSTQPNRPNHLNHHSHPTKLQPHTMEPLRKRRSMYLQPNAAFSRPDLVTSKSYPALRQEVSSSRGETFDSAPYGQRSVQHLRVHSSISTLATIREQEVQRAYERLSGEDDEGDDIGERGIEDGQNTFDNNTGDDELEDRSSTSSYRQSLLPLALQHQHTLDASSQASDIHPAFCPSSPSLPPLPPSPPSSPPPTVDNMLTLFTSPTRSSTQHYLSHLNIPVQDLSSLSTLLYTRGRLQELGCTFTLSGELTTYGAPSSSTEFDSMLRLGPVYDEQWRGYFSSSQKKRISDGSERVNQINDDIDDVEDDADEEEMWSDLSTLKRMLSNEGIQFGWEHRRITHGDCSLRIVKLCNAYDDLRTIWAASKGVHGFAYVVQPVQMKVGRGEGYGSGTHDALEPNKQPAQSTRLPTSSVSLEAVMTEDEGYGSMNNRHKNTANPKPVRTMIHTHHNPVYIPSGHEEAPPRNIGWRFSDDDLPLSAVTEQGILTPSANTSSISVVDWATVLKSTPPPQPHALPLPSLHPHSNIPSANPGHQSQTEARSPSGRQEKGTSWHSTSTSRTKFTKMKAVKRWFGGVFGGKK